MSDLLLNNIQPGEGAKKDPVRVGRGIGSTLGKTCGRGHKGALARAGSKRRLGFEGGQMPLQRRIPKSGFNSKVNTFTTEVKLALIAKLAQSEIDLTVLKEANLVKNYIRHVKVIGITELSKAITIKGLAVTANVRKIVEAAGGQIVDNS